MLPAPSLLLPPPTGPLPPPTFAPIDHPMHSSMDAKEMRFPIEPPPPATLRLLEDYPEPLTSDQRSALRRHAASLVHRHVTIRKGARVIESGYRSLCALLERLEAEQARLRASLDALGEGPTAPPGTNHNNETETNASKHNKEVKECAVTSAPPPRRAGGLLRSAAFANLRGVLHAAKREEQQQQRADITRERERVAKSTQLRMLETDLAEQRQHLAPLSERYERSRGILQTARSEALSAVQLYEDARRMETAYASRFFLRASGNAGASEDPNAEEDAVCYDVFFAPAAYSAEVEDMIREQVEEVLHEYLAYRRRVDPVLETLAEQRRTREAQRADQLLQLIGVDTSGTRVAALGMGFAPSMGAVEVKIGAKRDARAVEVGRISDAEDEDDGVDSLDGMEEDNASANGAEPEERQRAKVRTALAALDDFEELY